LAYTQLEDQISLEIDKNNYTCIINVKGDGFCGFRAISVQVYGDESMFFQVKQDMRDTLLENREYYIKHFSGFIEYEQVKRKICYAIDEEIGSDNIHYHLFKTDSNGEYWFSLPACGQIVADTFFSPVATFTEKHHKNSIGATYIPLLGRYTDDMIKSHRPQPLVLHRVHECHWITLSLKKSITFILPMTCNMYQSACSSMNRHASIKRSAWNQHLTFRTREKTQGTVMQLYIHIFTMIIFTYCYRLDFIDILGAKPKDVSEEQFLSS
jgi:hypothetical protein